MTWIPSHFPSLDYLLQPLRTKLPSLRLSVSYCHSAKWKTTKHVPILSVDYSTRSHLRTSPSSLSRKNNPFLAKFLWRNSYKCALQRLNSIKIFIEQWPISFNVFQFRDDGGSMHACWMWISLLSLYYSPWTIILTNWNPMTVRLRGKHSNSMLFFFFISGKHST